MIDQSKVNDAHQMLMVSLRVGERALPLAWRMKKTQGAIGFCEQKEALEAVAALLPKGARVATLMGDRFYGSPALIEWCRDHGWGWRLRCKQDLLVFDENGGETTLADCFARGEHMLTNVQLTEKRARTNIAMLHEEGHANRGSSPFRSRPPHGAPMTTACAGASKRCSPITRRAVLIWKTARSSAPIALTGWFSCSASRSTGQSLPECGMRWKT